MRKFEEIPLGTRPAGPWLITADWIVADNDAGRHLIRNGEVVIEKDKIVFVGQHYEGEVLQRFGFGKSLISPGFIDLDALSDLDTTLLSHDNDPGSEKGRVWPTSYIEKGPYEMYNPDELAFQKKFAFAQLLMNGITSAVPIASLFYREWGETEEEFISAANAANELGIRTWLGPAYRAGGMSIDQNKKLVPTFDPQKAKASLSASIRFAQNIAANQSDLVSPILAPDRVETCTKELLQDTFAAASDLGCSVRLHMSQGEMELKVMEQRHGCSGPQWLNQLGLLSDKLIAPHATHASADDLALYQKNGVHIVHCPLVFARHGEALNSFSKLSDMGINIAMGTDTAPPDMVLNMAIGVMTSRIMDNAMTNVGSRELFDAATINGARALGRSDIGKLAKNTKADIAVFKLDDPYFAPAIDPIQTLVLGATGRVTKATIVDGRVSMRNGAVAGMDMQAARDQAQEQFAGLLEKYPDRSWGHPALSEIFPPTYPLL